LWVGTRQNPADHQVRRDFELDPGLYGLRRSGRALTLERIPMELLLLLVNDQELPQQCRRQKRDQREGTPFGRWRNAAWGLAQ
jgi:hypothetical protein